MDELRAGGVAAGPVCPLLGRGDGTAAAPGVSGSSPRSAVLGGAASGHSEPGASPCPGNGRCPCWERSSAGPGARHVEGGWFGPPVPAQPGAQPCGSGAGRCGCRGAGCTPPESLLGGGCGPGGGWFAAPAGSPARGGSGLACRRPASGPAGLCGELPGEGGEDVRADVLDAGKGESCAGAGEPRPSGVDPLGGPAAAEGVLRALRGGELWPEEGEDEGVWDLLRWGSTGCRSPGVRPGCLKLFCRPSLSQNLVGDQEHLTIQVSELEEEVSTLRKINKNLFDFSARIITKPAK